jgi:uncharacterized protein (TIGR02145 family)
MFILQWIVVNRSSVCSLLLKPIIKITITHWMQTKNRIWIGPLIVIGLLIIIPNSCKKEEEIITDSDGNVYTSVTIGTQVWMVENLKTTKYNDGTAIPLVTDSTAWAALSTPGYCWYNNDEATYKSTYGALYNWYVVNTGKLCPIGWHVPSDAEWHTLLLTFDKDSQLIDNGFESNIAGGKLKEAGTTHWQQPNEGATNESGFTALPGGSRHGGGYYGDGTFGSNGIYGPWWTSSDTSSYAYSRYMYYDKTSVFRDHIYLQYGFSVRCLKDN